MASPKGSAGEYSFTRAAYDEQADNQEGHHLVWDHAIYAGSRKGVWKFVSHVRPRLSVAGALPYCSLTSEWPNSSTGSFAAFWYQHCHKLARMAENAHIDRMREKASRVE